MNGRFLPYTASHYTIECAVGRESPYPLQYLCKGGAYCDRENHQKRADRDDTAPNSGATGASWKRPIPEFPWKRDPRREHRTDGYRCGWRRGEDPDVCSQ